MRVGSICSGYGGAELAVKELWPDAVPVWFAEVDKWPSAILAARWPGVPNLGDITTVDWEDEDLMGAPRNDALAQRMYDRYCQGLSVEQVAAEFNRSRQTVWRMFNRRGWDMRPRPPALPTVVYDERTYSLGMGGYYRWTAGDRHYLHRRKWEDANGRPIPSNCDVHHRDHDKTNNDSANLQLLTKSEHTRLHAEEVVPTDTPAVDILTAGYP